jgi:phosphatidate cytidylyltransferase
LKQRIITALFLVPVVLLAIFFLPLDYFVFAIAGVTLIGFWEWTQFISLSNRIRNFIPGLIITSIASWTLLTQRSDLDVVNSVVLSIAVVWWVIASYLAIIYPRLSNAWQDAKPLKHLFGWVTMIPFLWSMVLLRAEGIDDNPFHGAKLVLYVCLIVWVADSAAYFAGRQFGKHKMAPAVSPNKTIEGLLGGVIASITVGVTIGQVFDISFFPAWKLFAAILFTVVISVLGDLVESMFKRVSGIKDSSNILPGHGGVLDRVDSLTSAFPVFAFFYFLT